MQLSKPLRHKLLFPIYLVLYGVSRLGLLINRDRNKWVFGSHFGFSDNSMFLFFDVNRMHKDIRPIWIAHNRKDIVKVRSLNYECYYWLSLRGLYHCFTAEVYVCTQHTKDINRFASEGAVYLNLNHGIGIKKCYWKNEKHLKRDTGKTPEQLKSSFFWRIITYVSLFRVPDICLATSIPHAVDFFCPMFRIPLSHCIFGNQPRNEMLLLEKDEIKKKIEAYGEFSTLRYIHNIEQYDKVYIYMPTWRDDGSNFIMKSHIDFCRLNSVLIEQNALLLLKLHPATDTRILSIHKYSNISLYDNDNYIYYVLPFTDCLITDYSSVYTDYLLMDKEIMLFLFDKEQYFEKCTDIDNYDYYYRGMRAYDFDSLISLIKTKKDCHIDRADYKFLMDYFWGSIDNPLDIVEEVKKRQNSIHIEAL